MSAWIAANLGNIIVLAILAVIVAAAVFKLVRDKKKGKSSCGCGCENCGMSESCNTRKIDVYINP